MIASCSFCYGRFLSIKTTTAPTIAMAMIIAAVEMAKYISVGGRTVTGYGDAVAAASSTDRYVWANDGP